ncbi:cubilin [Clonorchis sinensis]|uniref:Cubilin n=1 Tax=Clonorchis sinensis TaxID=79923 RepID=G7YRJ8_CLOSI|nr:cubilin [Clonorchis sinensis]
MNVSTDAQNTMPTLSIPILSHEAACSELIENEYGSVTWTSESTEKRNCDWQIRNPSGKPVLLHFKTFKVGEKSANCQGSYVSVIDVNGNTENELGKWCDTEGEDAWLMSTGSSLLIRLRTDKSVEGDKFEVTYVSTSCQFEFNDSFSYIESPPGEFVSNHPLRCLWRIRTPNDIQMWLKFLEFNVGGNDENCETNGLHILSEVSGELAHIAEFCGNKTPREIMFEQKHLTLFLNTNAETTHKMFKATCAPENFQRTISLPTGNISFGGKNKLFVKDANWTLKPMDGKRVILSFHSISLGGAIADCKRNYVKVYDGQTAEANLLETYCGTIQPIPIVSSGPHMFIHLRRTDAFKNDRFMAHHTSSNCIHTVSAPSGEIRWTKGEEPETECIWKLQIEQDAPIDLRFQKLLVGGAKETCEGNRLEVYDGDSTTCCLLKSYCGRQTELVFLSSKTQMDLKLFNLKYRFGDQFIAEYETPECQITKTDASGSFMGPPDNFEGMPHLRCLWKIVPAEDQSVSLQLLNIKIGCKQGVVKVYRGTSGQLKEVGSYCDALEDQTIESTDTGLTVYLSTNVPAPPHIFEGTYTIARLCVDNEVDVSASMGAVIAPGMKY